MIVSTIGDLIQVASPTNNDEFFVLGYNEPGDGGGGHFIWKVGTRPEEDKGLIFYHESIGTGYFTRLFDDIISVKWFGADASGVNDATLAFQHALNAAHLAARVFIPNGTYKISSQLNIVHDNVAVICDSNAVIQTTGSFTLFNCGHSFVEFKVNIKGPGTKAANGYNAAIALSGSQGCNIHDCHIEDFSGNGITLSPQGGTAGCMNNTIQNNTIINCVGKDSNGTVNDLSHIRLGYSGSGYMHTGNKVINNTLIGNHNCDIGAGIIGHGYENIFSGNTITGFDAYGIIAYESAYGDGSAMLCYKQIITGNTVSDIGLLSGTTAKGMGIYLQKSHQTVVADNMITDVCKSATFPGTLAEAAIGMAHATGSIVKNNVIRNSYRRGINNILGFNTTISGNTIDTCGEMAIRLQDSADSTVTGNTIRNTPSVGIYGIFRSTADSDVAGNVLLAEYAGRNTGTGIIIQANTIEKHDTPNQCINLSGTVAGTDGAVTRNDNPIDGIVVQGNAFRVNTTGINIAYARNSQFLNNNIRIFNTIGSGIVVTSNCDSITIAHNDIKPDSSIANITNGIVYTGTNPVIKDNRIGVAGVPLNFASTSFRNPRFRMTAASAPASGTWTAGDYVDNLTPVMQGTDPARQYFVKGWVYVGTGWQEDRVYPGLSITDKAVNTPLTGNTTLSTADEYAEVDASAGAVTITLPGPGGSNKGKRYFIKKIDTTNNNVTVISTGGFLFDSTGNSRTVNINRGVLFVESNGSSWSVITLDIPGSGLLPRVLRVTNAHGNMVIDNGYAEFSTGNSSWNYQLIAAASYAGKFHLVKKIDSGSGNVQVLAASGETIDGAASYTITGQWSWVLLYCDGIAWKIISVPPSAALLKDFYADQGNSSTTPGTYTALYSYTIPANWLVANGEKIVAAYSGKTAATGNGKSVRLLVGGTTCGTFITTAANGSWQARATMIKTGSSTARVVFSGIAEDDTTVYTDLTGLDFTSSITFAIWGTSDAGAVNDIVAKMGTVKWEVAAP